MLLGRSSARIASEPTTPGWRGSAGEGEAVRLVVGRWRISPVSLSGLVSQAPLGVQPGFYWRPSQGTSCAAFGVVCEQREGQPGCSNRLEQLSGDGDAGPVRWFGGFAFDPATVRAEGPWAAFGASRFVVPEVVVEDDGRGQWLTLTVRVGEEGRAGAERRLEAMWRQWAVALERVGEAGGALESPRVLGVDDGSRGWYGEAVAEVVARIDAASASAQGLRKVVLARPARVALSGPVPPGVLLEALSRTEPQCTQFMVPAREWDGQGAWWASDGYFAGSTPEWLVRVASGEVQVDALAGTAGVGAGRALLESAKDRFEHALVVDAVADALGRHCVSVERPSTPGLKELRDMLHLWTPFRGRLAAGQSVLDVARSLHPTPAVCGHPTAAARQVLGEIERAHGFERGWYTGGVGWYDLEGQGEFAVALRCGRLTPTGAELYVGAGLVAGSAPEAEVEETRIKLRPMLRALGADEVGR